MRQHAMPIRVGQSSIPSVAATVEYANMADEKVSSKRLLSDTNLRNIQSWAKNTLDFNDEDSGTRMIFDAIEELLALRSAHETRSYIEPDDPDEILLDFVNQFDQGKGDTYEFDRATVLKMLREAIQGPARSGEKASAPRPCRAFQQDYDDGVPLPGCAVCGCTRDAHAQNGTVLRPQSLYEPCKHGVISNGTCIDCHDEALRAAFGQSESANE